MDQFGVGEELRLNPRGRQEDPEAATTVAQATLRLRSELQCERVIRLAHGHGVASATAYRGPEEGDSPIFVMLLDGPVQMDRFLPELREIVPEAPISVMRETVEHAAPSNFLRAGVIRSRPFAADIRHLGWVFAGGGWARVHVCWSSRWPRK